VQQRLGMTVVYVTHDQVEAMSMAERVVLIREGRIEQEGSPEDLYARPATVFAARFIGTPGMNLLALADGPGGAVVRGSQDTLFPAAAAGSRSVVRPETCLAREFRRRRRNRHVLRIPWRGHDPTVRVGEETLFMRAPGQLAQDAGTQVRLAWKPGSLHLFDAAPECGRRRSCSPAPRRGGRLM